MKEPPSKNGASVLPGAESAAHGWGSPDPPRLAPPRSFWELFVQNRLACLAYCSVFWNFGMCVAFLGPTLLDLGCLTGTTIQTMSWVFFAQLMCSLIGSMFSGYLAQKLDANLVIFISTIIIPIAMFLIPFSHVLGGLSLVLSVMGINMGIIDCLANLQMIQLFGERVGPFLQAMHFCYGLGAFVSPMIAEPFLLNQDCTPLIDNSTELSAHSGGMGHHHHHMSMVRSNDSRVATTLEEAQAMTQVKYAFWIMAMLLVPVPMMIGSLMIKMRRRGWTTEHHELMNSDSSYSLSTTASPEYANIDEKGDDRKFWHAPDKAKRNTSPGCCASSVYVLALTISTACMLFLYDGLQSAFGGYVYSYAVKTIHDMDKSEGAYLNACFWGTFSLGRLAAIFIATRMNPAFMLLCNIVGCQISFILMVSMAHNHIALYVGTCMLGIFLSSITPTSISLVEQYIDVTSSITALLVVVAALGEMVCPVVVGNLFVTLGPVSFLGFGNVVCMTSFVVFAIIWFLGRKSPKYKPNTSTSTSWIWCPFSICLQPQADVYYEGPPNALRQEPYTSAEGTQQLMTRHIRCYSSQHSADSMSENGNAASNQ